mgnify:CR=1 FL=1
MADMDDITAELITVRDWLRWGASRFGEAGLVFGHPWPYGVDVGLSHRVGRASPDVGIEGAALEQVAHQMPRALGAANIQRAGAAQNPA